VLEGKQQQQQPRRRPAMHGRMGIDLFSAAATAAAVPAAAVQE
jgi:hypothetical protein